jgi:hypothetical protein
MEIHQPERWANPMSSDSKRVSSVPPRRRLRRYRRLIATSTLAGFCKGAGLLLFSVLVAHIQHL